MNDILVQEERLPAFPASLEDQVWENIRHAEADATVKAHDSDMKDLYRWCKRHGVVSELPMSPEVVAAYITDLAAKGKKVSTVKRRLASISVAHRKAGHESPTKNEGVRLTLKGIERTKGKPRQKKAPLRASHIRAIPSVIPEGMKGVRDLAILLLGFSGGFRRSELVGLDVEDIECVPEGLRVIIVKSKTDQSGQGRILGISRGSQRSLCPVVALEKWLEVSEITGGPIFRPISKNNVLSEKRLSGRSVANIVKKYAAELGLDPESVAAHSLRSGFATECLQSGVPSPLVRQYTGHKSENTLAEYFIEANLFATNLSVKLGL